MWNDERDLIMELFEESNADFPKVCPCCEKKDGHVFFYKSTDESRLGSAWAWCSSCKEYSHSRHLIPDWWRNMDGITINQLCACPENLDEIKSNIDNWVNNLKPKK